MTLGTLMHHVIEIVFSENEPVPDAGAVEAKTPAALNDALRRYSAWLNGPGWATERASLLREAQTIALSWGRFLRDTGAIVLHNEVDLEGNFDGLLIAGRADCLLSMPDGRVLVVDHKRSKSFSRRNRMSKGWDLQVALYRAMLERPSAESPLTRLIRDGAQTVTAYHTMLDATVLTDVGGDGLAGAEVAATDISVNAIEQLKHFVSEVGAGTVRLNHTDDIKVLEKDRGITPYALKDNGFVAAFVMPADEDSE
jgi:RecB family exonuclease